MGRNDPSARAVIRIVAIVVLAAIALYLVYLLRKPIGWLGLATFIALAVSGPTNRLARHMPRAVAIALVYLGLVAAPVALGAIVIPPLVTEATQLADDLPSYADDVKEFVNKNPRLRKLDAKYDFTGSLEEQAAKLPNKIGDAASILADVGLGVVNSVFALITILILSIFMVASGRSWVDRALMLRPEHERERIRRILDHTSSAVSGYVQGALTVALIAGVQTYIVLWILGVPFRGPLAVLAGLFSLIPLIGATIAAVIIGLVTLFTHFPTATIIWAIWAIVYQQIENTIIQPQIQRRTVQVQPFIVLVAVLFGSTLLGIIGALVAIPLAASIQIMIREWWAWRQETKLAALTEPLIVPPDDDGPPPEPGTGTVIVPPGV